MLRARLALGSLLGVLFVPAVAAAQTTSGATVSATSNQYPDRSQPLRAQNLTPQGVSYADCMADMTLTFHVLVSGFDGSENLQIWASKSSDCQSTTDRGLGATAALCWLLPGGFTAQPYSSTQELNFTLRVQDIMAWQNAPPFPPAYHQAGPEACTAQATFTPVPININFLPLDSNNYNVKGTFYQYTLGTDTVGPPAPQIQNDSVGHTLFNVYWNVNTDTDTTGYDVFIDPIPGKEIVPDGGSGGSCPSDSGTPPPVVPEASVVTVCPDTGSPAPPVTDSGGDGSSGEGGGDGSTEASTGAPDAATSTDAGCYTYTHGGTPVSSHGYTCNSTVLASGFTQDAGASSVVQYDDAGNLIEGGTVEGAGGISTIPDANRVPGNNPTVSDKSRGNYQITGLVDCVTYNVVVAAVDGYGNVGPPSSQVCDFPAPVQDFWQTYKADGGAAGGFCSLEAVGAGGTSLAGVATLIGLAGIVRRQRRKSR
jgi:hypothetical protein